MKIVLTGAGGCLGSVLAPFLAANEQEVVLVARRKPEVETRFMSWDGETSGTWAHEIDGSDAGFRFDFPTWSDAARDIVSNSP